MLTVDPLVRQNNTHEDPTMPNFRCLVFFCVVIVLAGCRKAPSEAGKQTDPTDAAADKSPPPPVRVKYASPEEVLAAAKAAIDKNDDLAALECLNDPSLNLMVAFGIVQGIEGNQIKNSDRAKQIQALFDANGLSAYKAKTLDDFYYPQLGELLRKSEANLDTLVAPVKKKREFVVSMSRIMSDSMTLMYYLKIGQVSPIKTNGSRAEAQVTMLDKKGQRTAPMYFQRQADGWRIDIPRTPKKF